MILNNGQFDTVLKSSYIESCESIRIPSNLYENIMLITANCGRGKTTFALSLSSTGLLSRINKVLERNSLFINQYKPIEANEVLFLTSRKIIASQQLKGQNVLKAIPQDFQYNTFEVDEAERQGKIRLTTAHQFGEWVRQGIIEKQPKVIILDEMHSIFAETIFAESLLYTIDFLIKNYDKIIKIGLTATPEFLIDYVQSISDRIRFKIIDLELGSRYKCKKVEAIKNSEVRTILNQYKRRICNNYKVIVYTMSARQCYKLSQEYDNADFIISDYNEAVNTGDGKKLVEIMQQNGTKDYIIQNERLPDNINILFINSACREGLNLKDDSIKMVICEAVDMITIEQILGRIRNDIMEFNVICNYHNYDRLKKNIEELKQFQMELADSESPQVVLSHRHGEQEQNKKLQKLVYFDNGLYKINPYAEAFLKYMNESYIQISNNKSNYISRVGKRDLRLCQDYLKQLCKYAENGKVKISISQTAIKEKNHNEAIDIFKSIENEWINKPIGKEEKRKLAEILGILRTGGKSASWTTLKQLLNDNGYQVLEKRNAKTRYSIITN